MTRALAVAVALLLALPALAAGQEPSPTPAQGGDPPSVLLILDSSKSMNDDDGTGKPKLEGAKAALNSLVDQLPDGARVGLRVYGSEKSDVSRAEGCKDTKLISPVAPLDRGRLKGVIKSFQAKGRTPIGGSLEAAAQDLPKTGKRTIVLVGDGGDNCAPPAPCAAAKRLAEGGIDLTIQAIGFQVNDRVRRTLECIAKAGNGTYVTADDAEALENEVVAATLGALRSFKSRGNAIKGAPRYQEAPLVKPGQYTDTIQPDTDHWYKADLKRGQSLQIASTVVADEAETSSAQWTVKVYTPELVSDTLDYEESGYLENNTGSAGITVGPAGSQDNEDLTVGTYFVRLRLEDSSGGLDPKDYPVELITKVVGQAQAEAPETGGGDGGGGDDGGSGGPSVPVAAAGGSTPNGLLLGLGVLGFGLAGAAAGAGLVLRRRPS